MIPAEFNAWASILTDVLPGNWRRISPRFYVILKKTRDGESNEIKTELSGIIAVELYEFSEYAMVFGIYIVDSESNPNKKEDTREIIKIIHDFLAILKKACLKSKVYLRYDENILNRMTKFPFCPELREIFEPGNPSLNAGVTMNPRLHGTPIYILKSNPKKIEEVNE